MIILGPHVPEDIRLIVPGNKDNPSGRAHLYVDDDL